jgi:hypothetical protein
LTEHVPAAATALLTRRVAANLTFEVDPDTVLALQLHASRAAGRVADEVFQVTLDGDPDGVVVDEVDTGRGEGVRVATCRGAGELAVSYAVAVTGACPPVPDATPAAVDAEVLLAGRPSRYCPSDELAGFAVAELAGLPEGAGRAEAVAAWVAERLAYVGGSSGSLDTALDTLHGNAGVCRDFAHLTIALCRALGVPARFVAAYAPGLSPMDFHAVVEARRGAGWEVLDATRGAPRQSLVRIATGRDAADTAISTTLAGAAALVATEVVAVVDGTLPADDHRGPCALA